jgi:hypothetical protein
MDFGQNRRKAKKATLHAQSPLKSLLCPDAMATSDAVAESYFEPASEIMEPSCSAVLALLSYPGE